MAALTPRVEALEGKMSDMKQMIAVREERDVEQGKKIDAMYKIIVTGNGQPPMPEMVRKHEEWIKEKEEEGKKTADANRNLRYTLIAAIFVQVIMIVVEAVKGVV